MKRRTISRYIISEILPPFFLGLLTFTFILLIARLLKLVELVVTRGVPILQIGKLFGLILPTFLELTVPMAFLLAILLGLGRLSSDHELLALKASGVSPKQILLPVAAVAIVVSMLTLLLTTVGRPAAQVALKSELYEIARTRVSTALRERVFNDDFPHILIYLEEIVPPGNVAQGVLIIDQRDDSRENIILGKVALIDTEEETRTLSLRVFDGSIYEREIARSSFSQTVFNIYDFRVDLDDLLAPVRERGTGPKELSFARLVETIHDNRQKGISVIPELMEFHQRISFAFVPLIFCLLGVSLSLLPRTSRTNRSWGVALSLVWFVLYYALLSFGKALGEKGLIQPVLALWLPNIVIGLISLQLFRKALYESPLLLQRKTDALALWIGHRLAHVKIRQHQRHYGE